MQITPTLNFGGNCRDAIQTYAKAFGGKINCLIKVKKTKDGSQITVACGL